MDYTPLARKGGARKKDRARSAFESVAHQGQSSALEYGCREGTMNIGVPELLIVLVIVVLLFGVGRVGQFGGELGKAIREFRKGLRGDDEKTPETGAAKQNPDDKTT
jgi:sec-independent protein translocase protein TatA